MHIKNRIANRLSRRTLLRGAMGNVVLGVSLPFLECFLNESGTALASGAPIPTRFGSWFWPMGHTPGHAVADRSETGMGIEFLTECEALKPHRDVLNFYSGFMVPLDGRPNFVHESGWIGLKTGTAPQTVHEVQRPTLDLLIADQIGKNTRFKTLDVNSIGDPSAIFSVRNSANVSAAEINPLTLYSRIFGVGFVDPNDANFVPDPSLIARKSVLSGVMEQSQSLYQTVSTEDRQRLDQYFTAIRQLENQLSLSLQKPEPNPGCQAPLDPRQLTGGAGEFVEAMGGDTAVGEAVEMHSVNVDQVSETHKVLVDLITMALVCDQTRVFNIAFSNLLSRLSRPGEAYTHHNLTHEEPVDPETGTQPITHYLNTRCHEAFAYLVDKLRSIPEGDGNLLDHTLVFAHSETSLARIHSVDNIPIFTAGKAGGRMKTGYHVVGNGDPITRVGLTSMRAMGVPVETWGTASLQTSRPIDDILA